MPEFSLRPTPQEHDAQSGIQLSFIPPALAGGSWCAGAKQTAFGTVLDETRIKAKRRLFMTRDRQINPAAKSEGLAGAPQFRA